MRHRNRLQVQAILLPSLLHKQESIKKQRTGLIDPPLYPSFSSRYALEYVLDMILNRKAGVSPVSSSFLTKEVCWAARVHLEWTLEVPFHVIISLRICFKHDSSLHMQAEHVVLILHWLSSETMARCLGEIGGLFDRLLYILPAELLLNSLTRDPGCFLNKDVLSFLYSL